MNDKFLIHAYFKRLPYVNYFLIPSMLKQGINEEDISVWIDDGTMGCLNSCMKAFGSLNGDGDTWHLQDDVLMSKTFKMAVDSLHENEGIVCGFAWTKDANRRIIGKVDDPFYMWYSFPCIRIPNRIAKRCSDWFFSAGQTSPICDIWIRQNRGDDSIFKSYLMDIEKEKLPIYNVVPNMVEHVDFIIGGSIVNKERAKKEVESRSAYFDDRDLVEQLKKEWRTFQNENINI